MEASTVGSRRGSSLGSRDSVSAGLYLEFTFTIPSMLSQGREGGFVSFFCVWSKKKKNQTAKAGIQVLTPPAHRDPIRLPIPPNFPHGAVVKRWDSDIGAGPRKGWEEG